MATKIFMGSCLYEDYNNSKVLKALCAEVGWIMDDDGNTYHKESLVIWTH